jgi:hypothetical protein
MQEDSTMRLSAVALIVTLALGLMTPLGANAPSPTKVPRIGFLLFYRPDAPHTRSSSQSSGKGWASMAGWRART